MSNDYSNQKIPEAPNVQIAKLKTALSAAIAKATNLEAELSGVNSNLTAYRAAYEQSQTRLRKFKSTLSLLTQERDTLLTDVIQLQDTALVIERAVGLAPTHAPAAVGDRVNPSDLLAMDIEAMPGIVSASRATVRTTSPRDWRLNDVAPSRDPLSYADVAAEQERWATTPTLNRPSAAVNTSAIQSLYERWETYDRARRVAVQSGNDEVAAEYRDAQRRLEREAASARTVRSAAPYEDPF